jgi:hypothetical protein
MVFLSAAIVLSQNISAFCPTEQARRPVRIIKRKHAWLQALKLYRSLHQLRYKLITFCAAHDDWIAQWLALHLSPSLRSNIHQYFTVAMTTQVDDLGDIGPYINVLCLE